MSEELKPCPFCGKPFEMLVNRDGSAIYKHDSDDCVMRRDDLTGWVWYNPETLVSDLNARPVEDALRAELGAAKVELLKAQIENNRTYCAYCGTEFLLDDDAAKNVTDHIKTCKKHPMRAVEAELAQAREALRSIAQSDPVVVDGKEWRMERKDAIDRAAAALLELLKEE